MTISRETCIFGPQINKETTPVYSLKSMLASILFAPDVFYQSQPAAVVFTPSERSGIFDIAKMPIINQPRVWQLHYCHLYSQLIDSIAIEKGIVTPHGVEPVLYFFIQCYYDDTVGRWLTARDGTLREGRFLVLVGWLHEQLILNVRFKSDLARYLHERKLYVSVKQVSSFESLLRTKVPSNIEQKLKQMIC